MTTINDLLSASIGKNPVEFSAALSDVMDQRAQDAIADRRIAVAQSIYDGDEGHVDDDFDISLDDFETEDKVELEDNTRDGD